MGTKRCKTGEGSVIQNLLDFTLPGFHYLGPGSKEENGLPTNAIDAIAKKHDDAYGKAMDDFNKSQDVEQSMQEIEQADEQFLEEMSKTKVATATEALGKAVGLVGIAIKAALEKSLGYTLYPAFDKFNDADNADCKKILPGDDFN